MWVVVTINNYYYFRWFYDWLSKQVRKRLPDQLKSLYIFFYNDLENSILHKSIVIRGY